jgi:hypothetical protein
MTDVLSVQPPSRDPFSTGPREHLSQILNMVAMLRLSEYRFLPLLLSKISDVLPRLVNPMLQNAPENSAMANIDIFDGFGNAGMAQPPPQMHMAMDTEYDRKFSVSEYEKKYSISELNGSNNDSASSTGSTGAPSIPPTSVADMNSPFVSSPAALMSPGMEFSHGLDGFACTPLSEMVMSPMSQQASGMSQSATINPQQTQHAQHRVMSTLQSHGLNPLQPQSNLGHNGLGQQSPNIGGINPQSLHGHQGMNHASMSSSHLMGGGTNSLLGMARQQPQRTNSFAIPPQPSIPRTVGDFHALQRANADSSSTINTLAGMAGLGSDMDFSGIR